MAWPFACDGWFRPRRRLESGRNARSLKAAQSAHPRWRGSPHGHKPCSALPVRANDSSRCGAFPMWRPIGPSVVNNQCFMMDHVVTVRTCVEHGERVSCSRKEVIQPHLPVRLPCYDFVPIADPTFGSSLPQGVGPLTSGVTDFHDVTGGVYKARERIHRSVADLRLLATPTSCSRVADCNPN